MNRHNLPFARHAATNTNAIGWVMIAKGSNCFISQGWMASIAEGDSIINATLISFQALLHKNYKVEDKIELSMCYIYKENWTMNSSKWRMRVFFFFLLSAPS